MYERPALDWNLRVQYLNSTEDLTHPSSLDTENLSMREAAIQMNPREIQIIWEQSIPFPAPLNLWMYRVEMKRRVPRLSEFTSERCRKREVRKESIW